MWWSVCGGVFVTVCVCNSVCVAVCVVECVCYSVCGGVCVCFLLDGLRLYGGLQHAESVGRENQYQSISINTYICTCI